MDMTSRISELLREIHRLEGELEEAVETQELKFRYRLEGARVRFEESVLAAHRDLKVNALRWLGQSQPRNVLSVPFIYAMIVPFVIVDLSVSFFQFICFPLYRISKVERSRYIVVDRYQLSYLNSIEKLNCIYCGYVNGLISYIREIVARTEQHWCPIKHARKLLDPHRRYTRFADFGDSDELQAHIDEMRDSLAKERDAASRADKD